MANPPGGQIRQEIKQQQPAPSKLTSTKSNCSTTSEPKRKTFLFMHSFLNNLWVLNLKFSDNNILFYFVSSTFKLEKKNSSKTKMNKGSTMITTLKYGVLHNSI